MHPNGASDVAAYDSSIPGFPGSTAGGQEEVGGQVSSCFILYLFFLFCVLCIPSTNFVFLCYDCFDNMCFIPSDFISLRGGFLYPR